MKKVEAIVRHHRLEEVKEALALAGALGVSFTEVRGFGRQRGRTEHYRGVEYTVDLIPKIHIQLFVRDEQLSAITNAILHSARTGDVGDGKMIISDVIDAIAIRTGERGEEVI
ncbi:Nitrogen regulatory protein P-II [Planctomycetes bacterium Pan216]|uniref:Nitrogen regulatory protein P-II n=1 Tax=Kolteria novifilia TaxID=2527975 RepID=A0A518B1T7_9BACT|nr:Nitrogen regulatory protein P-II [Planctomycetes bacterium Pan216]